MVQLNKTKRVTNVVTVSGGYGSKDEKMIIMRNGERDGGERERERKGVTLGSKGQMRKK